VCNVLTPPKQLTSAHLATVQLCSENSRVKEEEDLNLKEAQGNVSVEVDTLKRMEFAKVSNQLIKVCAPECQTC
jgi:hypothetical protein